MGYKGEADKPSRRLQWWLRNSGSLDLVVATGVAPVWGSAAERTRRARERGVRAALRLVSATGQEVLPHTLRGRGVHGADRPVLLCTY